MLWSIQLHCRALPLRSFDHNVIYEKHEVHSESIHICVRVVRVMQTSNVSVDSNKIRPLGTAKHFQSATTASDTVPGRKPPSMHLVYP